MAKDKAKPEEVVKAGESLLEQIKHGIDIVGSLKNIEDIVAHALPAGAAAGSALVDAAKLVDSKIPFMERLNIGMKGLAWLGSGFAAAVENARALLGQSASAADKKQD